MGRKSTNNINKHICEHFAYRKRYNQMQIKCKRKRPRQREKNKIKKQNKCFRPQFHLEMAWFYKSPLIGGVLGN